MSDVLCIYYSRTGRTKQAMEEIASEVGGELVRLRDGVERGGFRGYLRCGLDAVRRQCEPLKRYETDKPLSEYRLIIIGTPIWAGRCSAPIRSFLKEQGLYLNKVAYVVTRSSETKFQEVYRQMDSYTAAPHLLAVSLRCNSVGHHFWQEQFIKDVRKYLGK
ncbi:hypothetical protein KQI82_11110 [Oscillibacter sp. MSJ-2]|uniref:Flavodoxin-like domain-containing protein n=1 Tax=Dysosmobacter acutus TaxID=2841504 RepID=A0ABS6FD11_9FIRM|nr:hypothetical protein [Dysosmobacter acutus]MBU5627457.1 hypothetical protein [Dysosmobacter acutus]